jgi:hypothetical protein
MSKLVPGRTFPVVQDGIEFQLKVLSGLDSDRLDDITAEIRAGAVDKKRGVELLNSALAICVAAWPWDGDIRSVLTNRECWQLIGSAIEGASLTADERKKFVSQCLSVMENSAEVATETA